MRLRLVPRSLLGQVMLAIAAALLVAQGIAAGLLYHAGEQRREIAQVHAAAFQLMARGDKAEGHRHHMRHSGPHPGPAAEAPPLPREVRLSETARSPLMAGEARTPAREAAIREIFASQGIALSDVIVLERTLASDPLVRAMTARDPALAALVKAGPDRLGIYAIRREGADRWEVARVIAPPHDPAVLPGLALQTVLLFAVLFGLLFLVLRRITRPLDALAQRTLLFAETAAPTAPLAASGPDDVRRLIAAHNAMEARIVAMLDEKDVMLGAIGHDLKTPLAALRVRIEAIEDEAARSRMAASIHEIAATLDDILALARVGRPGAPAERTELTALAAGVVEEFEDLGEPVSLAEGERVAAAAHVAWLKRGLRNLVANALRYAGGAEVEVAGDGEEAVLRVRDRGPGIPEDQIAAMIEPFRRGEASRNRDTGGAGLGLALTRAVAEQHGGRLVLKGREGGGLVAEIRIPRS